MALSPRDKRALAIFGGVAGAAVILWLLVLRGGGDETPPDQAVPTTTPPTVETTEPPRTPPPGNGVGVIGQRDPFDPLIETSPGGGGGPSPSPTGDGNGDGNGGGGGGDPTVSPPPPPDDEPGDDSSTTVGGHTVVLLGIFEQGGELVVQVEVDGTVHIVEVGETFAGNFELLSIGGDCATFRFGDQTFTLCEEAPK